MGALPVVSRAGVSEAVVSDFYRAFEDRHRGSRTLIKARLGVYLPFVNALASVHSNLPVLDLGCGRGEWLELLQENNISAQGVDLDEGMLAACRERGFSVCNADAIAHLKAQADQSFLVVSGFHLAEHLPFALLQELLAQAQRVLMPGGLLILETPNPENLVVGTASFYLDPTHQRPLPWQLLSFMAEYQGYCHVKLLRLQEDTHLVKNGPQCLFDVLSGVSPDYAIVAQKTLSSEPHPALERVLATEVGLSLDALASRYDLHIQETIQGALSPLLLAIDAAQHTANHAQTLAQHNAERAEQLAATLSAVYASQSWRLTRPLRWLARQLRTRFKQP
ncbi:MAG: class I SAM-dependent methyltransferase [Gallionella sp.]|nr:class I SAM-dependent methyltransferase [Gallionella sp.]